MPTVKGALRRVRGAPLPVPGGRGWRGLSALSAQQVLDVVYELILGREPDPTGTASYLSGLQNGSLTPQEVAQWAVASGEWWSVTPFPGLGPVAPPQSHDVRPIPPGGQADPRPGRDGAGQRHRRAGPDGLSLSRSTTWW